MSHGANVHVHVRLQAAIQAAGLVNPVLLPGLLQGMQQNLAAAGAAPATSGADVQIPAAQFSMMLPSQQSVSETGGIRQ